MEPATERDILLAIYGQLKKTNERLEKIEKQFEWLNRLRDLSRFKDVPRDEISGSGYVLCPAFRQET